jgi:predicted RNA-binding Zn ribbon-like protein
VKARDEEFKPLDNATARLTIRPVYVAAESVVSSNAPGALRTVEVAADPSGAEPGRYEAMYVARQTGAYDVNAVVTQADGQVVGRAEAGWTADPAVDEFCSLKPNRALLETLARRTGGKLVAMQDLGGFVRRLPERRAPVTETVAEPLWRQPAVFLFVLACFITDWGIRRRKGLP